MWIWIIISWVLVGLFSYLVCTLYDLRGTEYDMSYFDGSNLETFLIIVVMGYISLALSFGYIIYKQDCIGKILWKLANIGIKKEK